MVMIVCVNASFFTALAPRLVLIVLGAKTHLWTKWAKTNHEVRVCIWFVIQISYMHMCG